MLARSESCALLWYLQRQIVVLQRNLAELTAENAELRSLLRLHAPGVPLPAPVSGTTVDFQPQPSAASRSPLTSSPASLPERTDSSYSSSRDDADDADEVTGAVNHRSNGSGKAQKTHPSSNSGSLNCKRKALPKQRAAAPSKRQPASLQPVSPAPDTQSVDESRVSADSELVPGHPLVTSALLPELLGLNDECDADSEIQHALSVPPALATRVLSMADDSNNGGPALVAPLALQPPPYAAAREHSLAPPEVPRRVVVPAASPSSSCVGDFGCRVDSLRPSCLSDFSETLACGICGISAGFCLCVGAPSPTAHSAVGTKRRASSSSHHPVSSAVAAAAWAELSRMDDAPVSPLQPLPSPRSSVGGAGFKRHRGDEPWGGGFRGVSLSQGLMATIFCIALCGLEQPSPSGNGVDSAGRATSQLDSEGASNSFSPFGMPVRIGGRSLLSMPATKRRYEGLLDSEWNGSGSLTSAAEHSSWRVWFTQSGTHHDTDRSYHRANGNSALAATCPCGDWCLSQTGLSWFDFSQRSWNSPRLARRGDSRRCY
jgi:hypothetical protein